MMSIGLVKTVPLPNSGENTKSLGARGFEATGGDDRTHGVSSFASGVGRSSR